MTYDDKYDAMPLCGKISVNAWSLDTYGVSDWSAENSRRYWRRLHRHYDPHKDWWADRTIGVGFRQLKWVVAPSKGKKRKTWRDFK